MTKKELLKNIPAEQWDKIKITNLKAEYIEESLSIAEKEVEEVFEIDFGLKKDPSFKGSLAKYKEKYNKGPFSPEGKFTSREGFDLVVTIMGNCEVEYEFIQAQQVPQQVQKG